jgi:hypothetical protein
LQYNSILAFNNALIATSITCFPDIGANHNVTLDLKISYAIVKPSTICLVFIIIISWCWHTNQLQLHNAFLNEILQEEMYIE